MQRIRSWMYTIFLISTCTECSLKIICSKQFRLYWFIYVTWLTARRYGSLQKYVTGTQLTAGTQPIADACGRFETHPCFLCIDHHSIKGRTHSKEHQLQYLESPLIPPSTSLLLAFAVGEACWENQTEIFSVWECILRSWKLRTCFSLVKRSFVTSIGFMENLWNFGCSETSPHRVYWHLFACTQQ